MHRLICTYPVYVSSVMKKKQLFLGFPTRSDTIPVVQPQKMTRGLNFGFGK